MSASRAGPLALASLLLAGAALAHHGRPWAQTGQGAPAGGIPAVSTAPPPPGPKAEDGTLWRVGLGDPRQTALWGVDDDSAEPRDGLRILGDRPARAGDHLTKAVRIIIHGQAYDIYPDRIRTP